MTDTEKKETKTLRMAFRMTPTERHTLDKNLGKVGLTQAEYIRKIIMAEPLLSRTDLMAIAELRRQGGLLKHYFNETGGQHAQKTLAILEDIQKTVTLIKQSVTPGELQ